MYYGFEFADGVHTTYANTSKTAGCLYAFDTKAERDDWVGNAYAYNTPCGPFRLAVKTRGMVAVGWRGDTQRPLTGWAKGDAVPCTAMHRGF